MGKKSYFGINKPNSVKLNKNIQKMSQNDINQLKFQVDIEEELKKCQKQAEVKNLRQPKVSSPKNGLK